MSQDRKTITLPADLVAYFEERISNGGYYGRPLDTVIEAIVAVHMVNCTGESEDDKVREFYKRLGVTRKEIQEKIMKDADEIREQEYAKTQEEERLKRKEKGEFDA